MTIGHVPGELQIVLGETQRPVVWAGEVDGVEAVFIRSGGGGCSTTDGESALGHADYSRHRRLAVWFGDPAGDGAGAIHLDGQALGLARVQSDGLRLQLATGA